MQQAQQLGRYHLLDRVAFGGMAEIYRAKTADAQGRLHLVAVKRVLAHLCEDDEFIQMLIDEARLSAMLKHPNIARVYEFCRTAQEYFIAMEYVDGKDLRALLEKARQAQEWLPEEHIAYICMHVARGLHAAHMQTDRDGNPLNIVHRDVSPSNVLLSYVGEVKLCDFGIAKAASSRSQTKTGVIKGKVKYMSPEQAMGRKLDRRSDLFSLGTLLYEMLALQAPFTAGTEIELLFAVRDARKRPIRELRPHLNTDLEIIIERAMAKSRSQRFQSGEEFAQALQAFLDTYYPNYRVNQLSWYLLKTFEREREREQHILNDYVISSGSAESVGENLLADVLGPDAEYTQFTAAFSQMTAGQLDVQPSIPSNASYNNAPNPMQQMRVLSAVSMSGIEEIDGPPTREKQRILPQQLDDHDPYVPSPSAQTMPRGQIPRVAVESGYETAILGQQRGAASPSLHADATAIVDKQSSSVLLDDGLHAQETAILSRQQVDALLARRGLGPQAAQQPARPQGLAPPQILPQTLADEPELHEASTQIFSMNSLPANIREVLQKKVTEGTPSSAAVTPPSAPAPSAKALPAMPSLNLQPLESDFHDASTAYLDWSPIEPAQQSELPMPEPSAIHPVRRTPTGAQAPIAVRPTGAQAPIAPRPTGAQAPIAPRPTGAQAPIAPAPPPARPPSQISSPPAQQPLSTPRPTATPQQPLPTPRPMTTPSSAPMATPRPVTTPSSAPMATPRPTTTPQQPLSTPRPMTTPSSAPRLATPHKLSTPSPVETPMAPAPRIAAPLPPVASPPEETGSAAVRAGLDDEWEDLPHLDSTMIARAGGVQQQLERSRSMHISRASTAHADAAEMPKLERSRSLNLSRAATAHADSGDMPTMPPKNPAHEDPIEHTLNTESQDLPAAAPGQGQFDDLPTPVKNAPALRDLGIDAQSDFAEDTSKGGLPRGLSQNASHVDAGQYLTDDDLETID